MRARGMALFLILAGSSSAFAQDFQVGARAKGMGGSYTAFEDDPISIWLNPAGIATQATQMSMTYQSYTQYELDLTDPQRLGDPEVGVIDPQILPSFQGFVFQVGDAEQPMAVGVAYVRPLHVKMTYDVDSPSNNVINQIDDQQFSRLRLAFGYDIKLKPAEAAGFLTHIALGAGFDVGFTKWSEKASSDEFSSTGGSDLRASDSATQFGYGLGALVGVYDNTENFKIVWGIGIQSKLKFSAAVDTNIYPFWSWPGMINMGMTFYLLQGLPLRVTVDFQWIDWADVLVKADPAFSTESFRSVRNASVGAEYKYRLKEDGSLSLLPRVGFRFMEAMWADPDNLPAYATQRLLIKTRGSEFINFTFGCGVQWFTTDGKARTIDVGFEVGGDADNFAFGYTHEF